MEPRKEKGKKRASSSRRVFAVRRREERRVLCGVLATNDFFFRSVPASTFLGSNRRGELRGGSREEGRRKGEEEKK